MASSPWKPFTPSKAKTLSQVLRVDKIYHETPHKIMKLWREFHLQRGWVSAALPTEKYAKFHKRAQESRSFVLPNKTDDGYVSIFLQHHGHHCLLTPLDQYRRMGPMTVPSLTLTHYTEFQDSHDIVLMRGEAAGADATITPMQGRVLSTLMHLFWLNDEKYAKHVHCFNHRQRDFHWDQVVAEVIGIAQQKVKTMTKDAEDGAFTFAGLKNRELT